MKTVYCGMLTYSKLLLIILLNNDLQKVAYNFKRSKDMLHKKALDYDIDKR